MQTSRWASFFTILKMWAYILASSANHCPLSTIFRLCICLYLSLQENKTQESSKSKKKIHEKAVK